MISYDDLFQICVKYTGDDYYVGDVISEKKLANARSHYHIPEEERVVALLDTTAFGSAKNGLAVGESGIYCRDFMIGAMYFSWSELSSLPITGEERDISQYLVIGQDEVLGFVAASLKIEELVNLISEIQYLTKFPPVGSGSREQWMLAVNSNGRSLPPRTAPVRARIACECS